MQSPPQKNEEKYQTFSILQKQKKPQTCYLIVFFVSLSLRSFVIQNVSRDREIKGFVDAQTTNLCLLSETCSISMMEKCRKLECQVNVTVSGYIFRPFDVKVASFLRYYYSSSNHFFTVSTWPPQIALSVRQYACM